MSFESLITGNDPGMDADRAQELNLRNIDLQIQQGKEGVERYKADLWSALGTLEANNRKEVALQQSQDRLSEALDRGLTQRLGIQMNAQTQQFQVMAWMFTQFENFDTKLEIAKINAFAKLEEQSYKHQANMERLRLDSRELDLREREILGAEKERHVGIQSFAV